MKDTQRTVRWRTRMEKAMQDARLDKATTGFLNGQLRWADHDSGIVYEQHAKTLAQLAVRGGLSERTMKRGRGHAFLHGWWHPTVPERRGRQTGWLMIGKPCDCRGELPRTCQREGCGKSLGSRHAAARYCSGACRLAAWRAARTAPVTLSVTQAEGQKAFQNRPVRRSVTAICVTPEGQKVFQTAGQAINEASSDGCVKGTDVQW